MTCAPDRIEAAITALAGPGRCAGADTTVTGNPLPSRRGHDRGRRGDRGGRGG